MILSYSELSLPDSKWEQPFFVARGNPFAKCPSGTCSTIQEGLDLAGPIEVVNELQ